MTISGRRWALVSSLLCWSSLQVVFADVPNPTPENYLRRAFHSLTVVNDYLYIDGGSLSQLVGGVMSGSEKYPSYQVNETLSLSLKESWTNRSAKFNVIPKSAPLFGRSALWAEPSKDSFYMWGGGNSYQNLTVDKSLWKFQSDGSGGGNWAPSDPANAVEFFKIVRTFGASYAVCNGIGLYLSGMITAWTTNDDRYGKLEEDVQVATPGILTYDFESKIWENVTTNPTNPSTTLESFGTLVYGTATCASSFGEKGIFMPIGGTLHDVGVFTEKDVSGLQSMTEIPLYDVASKTWHQQMTTSSEGEMPLHRDRLCVTGALSQNNTYEIFMYGGYHRNGRNVLDDVWVLTIPGFRWFKGPSGPPRSHHECKTIGNRQMAVIGGYGKDLSFREPDELTQGIGIFDMTSMSWSTGYDANAAPYDSPQVVKDWYRNNGLASVNWTTQAAKNLFITPNPVQTPKPASNIPHIVGAVIGPVLICVITALVIVYIRRRKRARIAASDTAVELDEDNYIRIKKHQSPQELVSDRTLDPEEVLGSIRGPHEAPAFTPPQELDGGPETWPYSRRKLHFANEP